jgi:hypothetical protein
MEFGVELLGVTHRLMKLEFFATQHRSKTNNNNNNNNSSRVLVRRLLEIGRFRRHSHVGARWQRCQVATL